MAITAALPGHHRWLRRNVGLSPRVCQVDRHVAPAPTLDEFLGIAKDLLVRQSLFILVAVESLPSQTDLGATATSSATRGRCRGRFLSGNGATRGVDDVVITVSIDHVISLGWTCKRNRNVDQLLLITCGRVTKVYQET